MTNQKTTPCMACGGHQIKALTEAGLSWLIHNHRHVNELNVFPVPDGDTGTNMMLTMRNAFGEISDVTDNHAGYILDRLAHGAMMGSRGNSGTILSQLWIGVARTLNDHQEFNARQLVLGLRTATDTAYRGVQQPVEGTILTVAREITEFCEGWIEEVESPSLDEMLEHIVEAGWKAVEKTPDMLPVLKKAGVVDSGGTGLMYILEGMLRYLRGESLDIQETEQPEEDDIFTRHEEVAEMPNENIYDVQFVIKGEALVPEHIKSAVEQMGDSAVVIGNDRTVKVHVHVQNPGVPLQYGANVGSLLDVVVENMLEQYYDYLARQKKHDTEDDIDQIELHEVEPGNIAVVAVAAGSGIARVFQQLDVAGLVKGGQTNNPSTRELLDVIESVNTDKVIMLPNNKNIILAAEQAAAMSSKQVRVIPTRSFPQGVAAMLPYQPDGDLNTVMEDMNESRESIVTGEITTATRSVELDGVHVEEGQVIGLLDGKLKLSGNDLNTVVKDLINMVDDLDMHELVTLYYGENIDAKTASRLLKTLAESYHELEFEAVYGGQAHYQYIFSIE